MSSVLVAALVLLAGLLLSGSPLRRLEGAGARPSPASALPHRGRRLRSGLRARGRPSRAASLRVDPAQSIGELSALLRAGLPYDQAWQHAARDCPEDQPWALVLAGAVRASREGADVPSTLRRSAGLCRQPEEALAAWSLAAAWEVAERSGAAMAGVLDRLAESLRADADARAARAAAMAGPRATARVLGWLPVAGLALGQLIGAEPLAVLVGDPLGRMCAVAGAVLALLGAGWTRRLVRAAESVS